MNLDRSPVTPLAPELPFTFDALDGWMDRFGIDVLVVSTKHVIRYLTGGYSFFFAEHMDALGTSRYLPFLVYPKGKPQSACYVGNPNERTAIQVFGHGPDAFWVNDLRLTAWGTLDAVELVVAHLKAQGLDGARIGVELPFLPADAYLGMRAALPGAEFIDSVVCLERLRAIKTPRELEILKLASEQVVDAMVATAAAHGPGSTTRQIAERLADEERARGLNFEYALVTSGSSLNRTPCETVLRPGDIISMDSGGNYLGYIGDLSRMAIFGEPDSELVDLLAEIDEVQLVTRRLVRPGVTGNEIYAAAADALSRSPNRSHIGYLAHGMGLVSHEAPRLTSRGPVPYSGYDEDLPLQAGMVVSLETTMKHPMRGFIKLEDTIAVTADAPESYGDWGRGWNRGGR